MIFVSFTVTTFLYISCTTIVFYPRRLYINNCIMQVVQYNTIEQGRK